MSRLAYIFILAVVGLAIYLSVHEESERRADIDRAAQTAIYPAVETACIERNNLRDRIWSFYAAAHPGENILDREDGRALLEYENCPDLAEEAVKTYQVARDAQ